MTEYEPGSEDVGVVSYPTTDGRVSHAIHFLDENGEIGLRIAGVTLAPEVAMAAAQKLTLAAWRAQDAKKWRDDQRDN